MQRAGRVQAGQTLGPIRGDLEDAQRTPPDAVIIGGGIYGICTLLECARAGRRALLLERDDFGSATSWSSHRIIHGGLRYLQSLDLPRLRDSVRERRWFADLLPGLIEPLPCVMPLYGEGLKRPSAFGAALAGTAVLSRCFGGTTPRIPGGRVLDRQGVIERFSTVPPERLRGGGMWHDGRMVSSERVMICLLRLACDLGGRAINHTAVTRVLTESGRVIGVEASTGNGRSVRIPTPRVIDCAGPWVARAEGSAASARRELFVPARAFNLVLEVPPPSDTALAVAARRPGAPTLFLVPWGPRTVAGTWHEPAASDSPSVMPTVDSIDRFLAELREAVPGFQPTRSAVRCVWSGLLPATDTATGEPSDRPRIVDHARRGGPIGLVSVSGVKFTTARLVAQRAAHAAFGSRADARPIGPLQDPLERSPLMEPGVDGLESEQLATVISRMRSEELAADLADVVLRRSLWYLCPTDGVLCRGLCEAFGIDAETASAELHRLARLIRGPLGELPVEQAVG
ncbi:MAG: FAD-dependent oxidoreductase [Phycisphaerales bacterium]